MSSDKLLQRAGRLKAWSQAVTDTVRGNRSHLLDTWDISVSKLTRSDISRKLEKVSSCGGLLELRSEFDPDTGEVGTPVLHNADFCGQVAVCPICAARLQARRQAAFRDPIKDFSEAHKHAYFITATIADGPDLREQLDHLVASWRRFRKMGQKRAGVRDRGEWGKVSAAIAHVEIKRGKRSGAWHPHIHALVFTNEMLDYRTYHEGGDRVPLAPIPFGGKLVASSKVSREWLSSTGDSMGLDIRPLSLRPKDRASGLERAESIWRQAKEVLKYATKFNSRDTADQMALLGPDYVTVMDVGFGRRLFNSYGLFRGLGLMKSEMVEPLEVRAGKIPVVYSMRWSRRDGAYTRLRSEDGPLFESSDPLIKKRHELLTKVNGIQGAYRARRYRILRAKPFFARRNRLADWERWTDENTKACHAAIWEARENHRMGDLNYWESWMRAREDEDRFQLAYWDRFPDSEHGVAEGFRWVLNHPPPFSFRPGG